MKSFKLMQEVAQGWIATLPMTILQMDLLAQEFRNLPQESSFKRFSDLVDQCQMLLDSLISFQMILAGTNIKLCDHTWTPQEEKMVQAVSEALKAFEKKDYNWLADVIEYELGNSLQGWLEKLVELKSRIDQMGVDREPSPA